MTVRVAVIGCGKIAERASLPNLVNYKKKARVKVLCDVVEAKARALRDKFELKGVDIEKDWKKVQKAFRALPWSEQEKAMVDIPGGNGSPRHVGFVFEGVTYDF